LFLIHCRSGKLLLCDWKVGDLLSERPFVRLDLIFPVACDPRIATFRSTV
jgi:hypothetical protein